MRVSFLVVAILGASFHSPSAADRGALFIRDGADTVVVDRFIRTGDTLIGSVSVKGQPRIDYRALLAPQEMVRAVMLGVYAPGAAANAPPLQRVSLAMQGDTVVADTPTGVHRIPTRAGAVPMFNNALALSELFTRRARLSGGVANISYFAINGGATLDVVVRPVGADSLTFTVAGQAQRLQVDPTGRILGGTVTGTPLVIGRLGPEAAAGLVVSLRDTAIAPKPDYSAPPDAPYVADEVRVQGPAGLLGGTLTKPRPARGRLPAVVTVTGTGQQDRDEYIPFAGGIRLFRQVADTLSRRGIVVLRLDDRGVGASGGASESATTADFADDIRAGIAFLRARNDVDPGRIGLVGHSEGGTIALMVAATDPRLRATVLMAAPGEPGIEISMAQNKFIVDRDTTLSPAQRDSVLRAARALLDPSKQTVPWLRFAMGYDPAPAARRVSAPTLILQGATDRQVPVDQSERLAALIRAGGNRDVTVRMIPATNHLFIADPDGDFMKYDKLPTHRVSADVLGPLADWLVLKLAR